MKWFKLTFSLGNVIAASKFSLAYFLLIVLGLTTMSFTDTQKKHAEYLSSYRAADSTVINHLGAFQNLFSKNAEEITPGDVQLNPQAISFVEDYINKQGEELEKMKTWAKPYFDLYDNILSSLGIPKEMKYLSVIESHLERGLISWAGAVGPWQIMSDEAHKFGLKVNDSVDERKDFAKSTAVAAHLMKDLYGKFGDWLLVVAAYNGGAGSVRKAIRKSGSRDFWALQYYLPQETRNHVKKFIGTHYLFEGGGGLTTMTASETEAKKFEVSLLRFSLQPVIAGG
jgi:membrane-bound lytic murein transglycosylase D